MSSLALPSPASHSYLGDGEVALESREVLNSESEYEILLYPLPDIVLFPGETIPLRIHSPEFIRRFILQRSRSSSNPKLASHIGIVHVSSFRGTTFGSQLHRFGTTMEIRMNFSQSFHESEMAMTGKGRHRFQILRINSQNGVFSATVKILDDNCPEIARIKDQCSSFPRWVYESLSPQRLARIAYSLFRSTLLWIGQDDAILQRWGIKASSADNNSPFLPTNPWRTKPSPFLELEAERDPVAFSYFLCANMPVDCAILQILLQQSSCIERLRMIVKLLQDGLTKQMVCSRCNQPLANKQDLFNVSGSEGLSNIYVNRYGSVHQTMTLRRLLPDVNLHLDGSPSTQDTWFPGYAWTILYCGRCHQHLGWRYNWVGQDVVLANSDYSGEEDLYDEEENVSNFDTDSFHEENNDQDYPEANMVDENGSRDSHQEPEIEDDDDLMAMPEGAVMEDLEESSAESRRTNESSTHTGQDGDDGHNDIISVPNVGEVANAAVVRQFWGFRRSAIKEL